MSLIIDFHTHIFPDRIGNWSSIQNLKKNAKSWFKPFASSFHNLQPLFRTFPDPVRRRLDQVGGLVPIAGLLIESSARDLEEAMRESGVEYSVVIAHPPYISNEDVIEASKANPSLIPFVNVPKGTPKPGVHLKKLIGQGAKGLKIHPAADGDGVDSPRYRALLKVADEAGLPVVIHTGCFHTHLLYKDPDQGHAERYQPWFENFKTIKFILAHMNFHEPETAMDLAEEHPHIYLDTSWQPTEVIGEAVRRIGAERILFATDWPFIGNNMKVGLSRIQGGIDAGLLNPSQTQLILGENAKNILGLQVN